MTALDLATVSAREIGLPAWYESVDTLRCRTLLSVDVELARAMAGVERERGRPTTVVFASTVEVPHPVLGNPYPRAVLLAALGATEESYLDTTARRLAQPGPTGSAGSMARPARRLAKLGDVPALRHRPGDGGRYLTAGVVVTRRRDGSRVNLGIYRCCVAGPAEIRIFMNPRSDGATNLRTWHWAGEPMPVAIVLGAHPVSALVGAAGDLTTGGGPASSDYEVVARLLGVVPALSGDPPVPVDAPCVIRGVVTPRLAPEGPFGEFKGYYEPARMSHVLDVDTVELDDSPVPFILPGSDSGVSLSQLDSEIRLYAGLVADGFDVRSVRYPAEGFGRYLALVESDTPSQDLVDAVLRRDRAPKIVLCGRELGNPWGEVGVATTSVRRVPFIRRGEPQGERVGILVNDDPDHVRVEY